MQMWSFQCSVLMMKMHFSTEYWNVICNLLSLLNQSAPWGWNISTVISNNYACDVTSHFTEVFKIMFFSLETSRNIMELHFCFSTFSNISTSPTFINISSTNLFGEKEKRAIRRQRKHLLLTFPFYLIFNLIKHEKYFIILSVLQNLLQ